MNNISLILQHRLTPLAPSPTGMYRTEWWARRGSGGSEGAEASLEEPLLDEDGLEDEDKAGGGGCSVEEIMTALEGCIMTDLLPLAQSTNPTISGKVRHFLIENMYNDILRLHFEGVKNILNIPSMNTSLPLFCTNENSFITPNASLLPCREACDMGIIRT